MRTETVIGVIGSRDMVERILLLDAASTEWRLVGAPHAEESQTYERFSKIRDSIDVALFTGALQYDLARRAGELTIPANYCPNSGASLSSALLKGVLAGFCDPAQVSIDTFSEQDVAEIYDEFGVDTRQVAVSEYLQPESAAEFAAFHTRLYRKGRTTAAVTTVSSVARELERAGVPTLRTIPTTASLRTALHTAAMQGAGSRLQDGQLATVVVELSTASSAAAAPSRYWQQELKLSLHRILLGELRPMGATIRNLGQNSFIVHTTYGALGHATSDYQVAPFLERIERELGAPVVIGVGLGPTAWDAETHALFAVERARQSGGPAAFMTSADGSAIMMPTRRRRGAPDRPAAVGDKEARTLERLVGSLPPDDSGPLIVDADQVAAALSISPRTARRMLQSLVASGLAWPMPPARSVTVGRPKQLYRLVAEKLPGAAS